MTYPPGTTLLAILIAKEEGYGKPGAIPTVRNNPLDLRHGPNASHRPGLPDEIGWYATAELGWQDGERQLRLNAERGLNLQQCIFEWAPASDGNDPARYLRDVIDGFFAAGHTVFASDPLAHVLRILCP